MKVVLINGSPRKNGCTFTALSECKNELEKNGVEAEIIHIGTETKGGCLACGYCAKTGKCVQDDILNKVMDTVTSADGYIFGTPVHYAAASGQLTSFLDRLFYTSSKKMADKPGACVVSCRRGGATAAFDQINKYFTINNMPVVSSQYWNMVHGSKSEDVYKDEEGMQTMRTLAKNMSWLLKCIEAGKKAGIEMPKRENKISTNYIR